MRIRVSSWKWVWFLWSFHFLGDFS